MTRCTKRWQDWCTQGLLIEVDHATQGKLSLPGPVLRFDDNPFGGCSPHNGAPPTLGQHNESIRAWLDETE